MGDRQVADRSEVRSVGRALELLEILQQAAPTGVRVCDVAQELGVDPATVSRMLSTMVSHGYASRLPNRAYTLGVRSQRLAAAWVDRLLQLAGPTMARVADNCGETVYLLQLVGTEAVTLARLAGTRRAMIDVEVGPTYPLWASAAGRALLASVPVVFRPGLLPAEPFPALTEKTTRTWSQLSAALEAAARSGIHEEDGEIDCHLSCYARPLLSRHRDEKLAIAISFESSRPQRDRDFIRKALNEEWRELAWKI
ncbi:IclR family transcriptional regulator [Microbaculum marinum]|uniref:IclR family transcriptional regulator n=1 Tax=Microbaculum marinum TaxID=1764581 RepID=A0AAW9RTK9_9HYPH